MMEEVKKLKKEHKIESSSKEAMQKLDTLPIPEDVKGRAKEILDELEEKTEFHQ